MATKLSNIMRFCKSSIPQIIMGFVIIAAGSHNIFFISPYSRPLRGTIIRFGRDEENEHYVGLAADPFRPHRYSQKIKSL